MTLAVFVSSKQSCRRITPENFKAEAPLHSATLWSLAMNTATIAQCPYSFAITSNSTKCYPNFAIRVLRSFSLVNFKHLVVCVAISLIIEFAEEIPPSLSPATSCLLDQWPPSCSKWLRRQLYRHCCCLVKAFASWIPPSCSTGCSAWRNTRY